MKTISAVILAAFFLVGCRAPFQTTTQVPRPVRQGGLTVRHTPTPTPSPTPTQPQ